MKIHSDKNRGFTLIEIMIVVGIIALLVATVVPSMVRARESSQLSSIRNNLRVIHDAKAQWALEQRQGSSAEPEEADLEPYMQRDLFPQAVVGETYNINQISSDPEAVIPVALVDFEANSTITVE